MNHRGTEDTEAERCREPSDEVTRSIIGAAIEVHRRLGPGLLESTYEECLCWELRERALHVDRQLEVPVEYKGIRMEVGYRIDLLVARQAIVELKTVDKLAPIHEAQLLTYMKLSGVRTGLLLNFKTAMLKDGIRRMVL